jgi:type IV secretory pathway VirB10-like protein
VINRPPTPEPVETVPVTDVPVARDDRRPTEQVASLPTLPQFEEVTVPAEAVIGLQLESSVSSDSARVEDRVEARVTRDVRAGGRVAIPAGSRVLGSVSVVERGGKMRERARLGVRFHTVILADGTELALQTETVLREGESPGNASAAKVGGGAIGGAILGAILGGGKGAAIGAGVGAGAGTAAVMAGGRKPAQIQAGSPMTVKVLSPVTVSVEK